MNEGRTRAKARSTRAATIDDAMHKPLAFLTIALLAGASPALAAGKLRIATEGAFPPWNAVMPTGELVGFEMDLARDLCRRMEADCEIVAQAWDGILPGLQQHRYDAIMAGMAITATRLEKVGFAGPYASEPTVFAAPRNSTLLTQGLSRARIDLTTITPVIETAIAELGKALAGKAVGVQVSTIQATLLEKHFPGVEIRTYGKLDEAALDLATGRLDAVLGSRSAVGALALMEGLHATIPFGPEFTRGVLGRGVGIAVRKEDLDTEARFTAAIDNARQDGTITRLSVRWFGFDVSIPDTP